MCLLGLLSLQEKRRLRISVPNIIKLGWEERERKRARERTAIYNFVTHLRGTTLGNGSLHISAPPCQFSPPPCFLPTESGVAKQFIPQQQSKVSEIYSCQYLSPNQESMHPPSSVPAGPVCSSRGEKSQRLCMGNGPLWHVINQSTLVPKVIGLDQK